jgi:hypothetical protein
MAPGNNNERIRRAAEGSTPPLSPEVRKRALWAAMASMRRRSPLRTAVVVIFVLLAVGAVAYALVRSFAWG